jgi:hypothetical protein
MYNENQADQDLHYLLFDSLGHFSPKASIVDPDQMAQMCWLIWIYSGHTCVKTAKYGVNGKG